MTANKREHDPAALKARLLEVLTRHMGRENALDMGELYTMVYGEPWHHKINDSGQLRRLIRQLQESGVCIASCTRGYYLPRSDSELRDYIRRQERRALTTLKRLSTIRKISLAQYLGQLRLDLGEEVQ